MNIDFEKPSFFVHQSFQQRNRLPECLDYINTVTKRAINTGVIIRTPSLNPRGIKKFVTECKKYTDLVIIDPEVYRHDTNEIKSQTKYHSYMDNVPSSIDEDWLEKILNRQRQYGASVLLSPSRYLESLSKEDLLKEIEWAKESQKLINNKETLFLNLTLHYSWLIDKRYLHILLNELIDLNLAHYYIRVLWPVMRPAYGQLKDKGILEGYIELCETMKENQRVLVLPTVSLTGWFLLGFGASGFSMGPSHDQQYFAQKVEIKRTKGQPSPARKGRYLERSLLQVVDAPSHDALLTDSEYHQCKCKFCAELDAGNSRRKNPWDHEAASLHQITSTAYLSAKIANGNRRDKVLKTVRKAEKYYSSLDRLIKPSGENKPSHLPIWKDLLE